MSRSHTGSYTVQEEIANAVTHGVGAALSIAGLTLLLVFAIPSADPWRIVSVSVFGTTLILLYLASTLYHALPHPPVKRAMQIADHCAIYLLIAGTYTPFLLVTMRGPWGWALFGILWGAAIAGCAFKIFFIEWCDDSRMNWISTGLYVAMGWAVVIALKPALELVPTGALIMMALGGLAYSAGVIFYLWERLPYNHAIWHVFVLKGSVLHFFAVLFFVVPVPAAA